MLCLHDNMDSKTHIEKRVDDQLTWLSHSSLRSKNAYMWLSLFEVVLGAAIAVCAPLPSSGTRNLAGSRSEGGTVRLELQSC
jgi:hypothetical protein